MKFFPYLAFVILGFLGQLPDTEQPKSDAAALLAYTALTQQAKAPAPKPNPAPTPEPDGEKKPETPACECLDGCDCGETCKCVGCKLDGSCCDCGKPVERKFVFATKYKGEYQWVRAGKVLRVEKWEYRCFGPKKGCKWVQVP